MPRATATRPARQGMSLIEVLISMFVLLFGLMGVAAIFPVGNHYVTEAEKYDFSSALAQNAFEELKGRGMLQPEFWLYAGSGNRVIDQSVANKGYFPTGSTDGPGHVFVIDPIGAATVNQVRFPSEATMISGNNNPWNSSDNLHGNLWPVRRITLPTPDPAIAGNSISMPLDVAETIFRLRDDLVVDFPEADDRPSQQLWDVDQTTNTLLRRQYKGNYSWLATIVPTTRTGFEALQPANSRYGQIDCDVSVVVFRKREEIASGERLIQARLSVGKEVVLYSAGTNTTNKEFVDKTVDDFRPGSWLAVMGTNQTTGIFMMKWYRVLSLDDESYTENLETSSGNNEDVYLRRAMLIGPDWPANSIYNLRVAILPGVVSVVTKPLKMENFSLWQQ